MCGVLRGLGGLRAGVRDICEKVREKTVGGKNFIPGHERPRGSIQCGLAVLRRVTRMPPI